jgi:hypothetical protein
MDQLTFEDFVSSTIADRKTIKCYFICVNHHFRYYLHLENGVVVKIQSFLENQCPEFFLFSFITISKALKRFLKPNLENRT